LLRRARRGRAQGAASFEDRPLPEAYVRAVEARTLRLRQRLRWLNAVSAFATREQIAELQALPFVERLDVVKGFRRGPVEPSEDAAAAAGRRAAADEQPHAINYGSSLGQVQQIGVPTLHDRGLHGEGVIVAVLDAGFDNLAHEAFATLNVLAAHDFVNGDDDVGNGGDRGEGSHGTATLSVLGGFRDGELIGPGLRRDVPAREDRGHGERDQGRGGQLGGGGRVGRGARSRRDQQLARVPRVRPRPAELQLRRHGRPHGGRDARGRAGGRARGRGRQFRRQRGLQRLAQHAGGAVGRRPRAGGRRGHLRGGRAPASARSDRRPTAGSSPTWPRRASP
jgi:hypothetical protein